MKIITYILISISLIACIKDTPPVPTNQQINITGTGGVYIINEGAFQFGNASVDYLDFSNGQVSSDVYTAANATPLGDVAQSYTVINNKGYIVVNNSGKIEVVNPLTFKSISTITGFLSPRYILPVSVNKAYVSDFKSNSIVIIDLNTNTKTGSIPCKGWTEEMVLLYGKAYVTNYFSNYLYVVNTATDVIEDSLAVSWGGNSMRIDKNGKLWLLCSGEKLKSIKGALYKINPITKQVELSLQFPNADDAPFKLNSNGTNDTLYYLNNNIYKMPINANSLPASAFVQQGSKSFYGLGVNPINGDVYAGDAIDYIQKGKVYIYKNNGTPITNFLTGYVPAYFYFKN